MNNFQIEGKIVEIKDIEYYETYKKRIFTIQTLDKYPTYVTLQLFKDRADENLDNVFDRNVTCHFNIKGYKGKTGYFNVLDCWKIEHGILSKNLNKSKSVQEEIDELGW